MSENGVECELVLKKGLLQEAAVLDSLIQECAGNGTLDTDILYEDELDMALARETDAARLQTLFPSPTTKEENPPDSYSVVDVSMLCKKIHEANRVRRDVIIAKSSHKNLMTAALKTSYERIKKLRNAADGIKLT